MSKTQKTGWHFQPDLNERIAPYYNWPIEWRKSLKSLIGAWSFLDVRIYILAWSVLSWTLFVQPLDTYKNFNHVWVLQIWLRHFLTILTIAGGLHLYFYTFKKQGIDLKYQKEFLDSKARKFHFNSQLLDNMCWVLIGTVSFLTAY